MEQDSQVVQVDSSQPSNSCQPSPAANTPASPDVLEPDHESSQIQPSEHEEANSISPHDPEYGPDPGLWKKITENVRLYWILNGPSKCQNHDCSFQASERHYSDQNRKFSQKFIFRNHISGEKIRREWLLYSPSSGSIFCFVCLLFSEKQTKFSESGFDDWKHSSVRIAEHENSAAHCDAMLAWTTRRQASGKISSELEKQVLDEQEYWRNLLKRVVAVIKFLAARGLAFRGGSEKLGEQDNGNYLGVIELISEFDPFLSSHLAKYGNKGSGRASYLSSTICNELIKIIGDKLLSVIIDEINDTKYFSFSVDSTPDLCHVDQLTVIVRYVVKATHSVVERFLCFLPIESHTGEALAATVLDY